MAEIVKRARLSTQYLDVVRPVIPANLRRTVQAGPLDEHEWCLLVPDSAALAKMRQVLPLLRETLVSRGLAIGKIRLKLVPLETHR